MKVEDEVETVIGDTPPSASPSVSGGKTTKGTGKARTSSTPPTQSKKSKKFEPQLIRDLPRAEEDALRTFEEIPGNHYQYNTLGRSREALEGMTCDCQYEHGVDDPDDACGHASDCINRLTQVECLPDDCRCRSYCRNQRFQRKEYAPIHVVQTEKKGFGLRAAEDLAKDSFIYEYVGDVVSQPSFLKRMRQYAEEGIRHFYFMMLQKDEFIDATKRGGKGRFANHSCNPNCYVAKWTVKDRVRMGIFASRNIKKDEELTFNYNVDRYGHDAQPCYCGEPNCVGFIGGKTQTDIAAMDDLYLDALGITEEVEKLGLKGSKKKKGRKLDEDFIPDLKPLVEKDVPKVVQAMRQTQSKKVLIKLLTRIKLTEDQPALRQIMRLRGFSVMTNILEDYLNDLDITILAVECMMTWPLIQRNKVEDSKINVPVKLCSESENETLATLSKKLLEQWEALEYAYRIPKRLKTDANDQDMSPITPSYSFSYDDDPQERPNKKSRPTSPRPFLPIKPLGRKSASGLFFLGPPLPMPPPPVICQPYIPPPLVHKETAKDIIAAAAAAAAEAQAAAAVAKPEAKTDKTSSSSKKSSSKHKKQTPEEKEANKEKRLLKLVGAVVVKCMSKYQSKMDHDTFKKQAKELTCIIAEKEKKSSSYKEGKLDSLSDEKTAKIKKFAKEYIVKVLRKMEKKRRSSEQHSERTPSGSGSTSTPGHHGSDDMQEDHSLPDIPLEDVMDVDIDEEEDDDGNEGHDSNEGSSEHHQSPLNEPGGKNVDDERPRVRFSLKGNGSELRIRGSLGFDENPVSDLHTTNTVQVKVGDH
ncbi:hypothetical protein C8Q75DRAFT_716161 [Abortiporus biennis]|nr:hypothetical protein C8Q75DRAFT_716161 [Abortiporus biennis]